MSRSNPHDNTPNPATRWFEWSGENGIIRYYDKEAGETKDVGSDFTFMLLDQLGSVRGWHDASDSGIYSNEVKDTRQDVMVVKSFKGGTLAEGIYKDIKDRVNAVGGRFNASCYIAFKNGSGTLSIGNLRLKGSALGAWMEFCKAHRSELYKKAVRIQGFNEGKKGRITYRTPILRIVDITPDTNTAANELDKALQEFLAAYLKRNKRDQVEAPPAHHEEPDSADYFDSDQAPPITDDDIPW